MRPSLCDTNVWALTVCFGGEFLKYIRGEGTYDVTMDFYRGAGREKKPDLADQLALVHYLDPRADLCQLALCLSAYVTQMRNLAGSRQTTRRAAPVLSYRPKWATHWSAA